MRVLRGVAGSGVSVLRRQSQVSLPGVHIVAVIHFSLSGSLTSFWGAPYWLVSRICKRKPARIIQLYTLASFLHPGRSSEGRCDRDGMEIDNVVDPFIWPTLEKITFAKRIIMLSKRQIGDEMLFKTCLDTKQGHLLGYFAILREILRVLDCLLFIYSFSILYQLFREITFSFFLGYHIFLFSLIGWVIERGCMFT